MTGTLLDTGLNITVFCLHRISDLAGISPHLTPAQFSACLR